MKYRSISLFAGQLLVTVLSGTPLLADIALPHDYHALPEINLGGQAQGLVTRGDKADLTVEMTSERVELQVSSPDQERPYLPRVSVKASFQMTNLGKEATLRIGFPVGPDKELLKDFSATIDSVARQAVLINALARASETTTQTTSDESKCPRDNEHAKKSEKVDWWWAWDQTFAANTVTNIVVEYWQHTERELGGGRGTGRYPYDIPIVGYILHTGAVWKNSIGRAEIILSFPNAMPLEALHRSLRHCCKKGQAVFDQDNCGVTLIFENLEPQKEDDIRFLIEPEWFCLERNANIWWKDRVTLAEYRKKDLDFGLRMSVPDGFKALNLSWPPISPEHLDKLYARYFEALEGIVGKPEEQDGRIILPHDEFAPMEINYFADEQKALEQLRERAQRRAKELRECGGRYNKFTGYEAPAYVEDAALLLNHFEKVVEIVEQYRKDTRPAPNEATRELADKVLAKWVKIVDAFPANLYAGETRLAFKDAGNKGAYLKLNKLQKRAQRLLDDKSTKAGATASPKTKEEDF